MNPWMMTLMLLAGWGIFACSARRRWLLLVAGAPAHRFDNVPERLRRTLRYGLAQLRMRRYPAAGLAHMLVFLGFAVLLLRTLILWGRGYDAGFNMGLFGVDTAPGRIYALLKDIFVVLVMAGAVWFLYHRLVVRPSRLTLNTEGIVILGIIITMMAADLLYDGAVLVEQARVQVPADASAAQPPAPAAVRFVAYEPAGSTMAILLQPVPTGALRVLKHAGFWVHGGLVLLFLNLLPYSKHFHVITGIPNVFFQELGPPGRLPPTEDIEGRLEREETLGVRRIDQFSWKAILDLYTCTECGRCSDHCPATGTGKKLSPKHFTVDLRNFLYAHQNNVIAAHAGKPSSPGAADGGDAAQPDAQHAPGPDEWRKDLVDGVIDPEVLWACTTCRACEQECPVFISYVDKIVDMRRYLVQERGEMPRELETAFRGMESSGNPWSFPAADRARWTDGLNIPTLAEKPDATVLFWSGCMPSFDERAKKVTRATVELMQQAGVDFAILGDQEQCTGDPARRAGNEYLFQTFARANVETLNGYGVEKKTIVTSCPHCFNTLKNEYPDFGGKYEVVHHTRLLAKLVQEGRLRPTAAVQEKVAYHDSCYLGRHNDEYDAPRDVLRAIPGLTILEPQATRDRGMCCGAGGAQMFKEEEPGDMRVNERRTDQLLETAPQAIASNCPFCMRMLTDGLAGRNREDVVTLDISELLHRSVLGSPKPS